MCVFEYGHRHAIAQMCRPEGNFVESILFFFMWILGTELKSSCLYNKHLSLPTEPSYLSWNGITSIYQQNQKTHHKRILGAAEVGDSQVQDQTESKHVLGARIVAQLGVFSFACTKYEFAEYHRPQFKNHYSKFRFLKNCKKW